MPVECARYMAERIPGARLVVPGVDHIPFYGDADGYAEEVEEFLTGARQAPVSDRVLTTVMFTDIVGSTERAAALGDARWRELVRRHDELMRAELERHRGRDDEARAAYARALGLTQPAGAAVPREPRRPLRKRRTTLGPVE